MNDNRLKYADSITLNRIKTLHPAIRERVREKYLDINTYLLGKGVRLRFAWTTRTNEQQAEIYAQGRTKLYDSRGRRLGIVTYANAGQSIHNYHLAFDIVLLIDKDYNGSFETASWDTTLDFDNDGKSDWYEVIDAFCEMNGITWGGSWRGRANDKPHFQFDFGLSWREMKAKIETGDYFVEKIEGKEYKYINV